MSSCHWRLSVWRSTRPRVSAGCRRKWSIEAVESSKLAVLRPPDGYSHKEQFFNSSLEAVRRDYPQLEDLVLCGDLVVVPRVQSYQERRADGYQEPELVFVLGAAHLSSKSARDVQRLVAAVRPDSVVVELCRSRAALMYPADAVSSSPSSSGSSPSGSSGSDSSTGQGGSPIDGGQASYAPMAASSGSGSSIDWEDGSGSARAGGSLQLQGPVGSPNLMNLSGPGLLPAFQRSLRLGGRSALLLRLLLGALSSRVSSGSAAGAAPGRIGGEFVAARLAAEALDAQIVLGDRPIEITLRRAWQALSWRRRFELAGQLLQGVLLQGQVELDEETIERLKQDDTVSLLFSQLGAAFPEVMAPLIYERDMYLAWSLKRSKAVNGAKRVVGIVGKGHLRGVCYGLSCDSSQLRFRDLVGSRESRGMGGGAGQLIRQAAVEAAAVGALLWAWTAWGEH